MTTLLAIFKLLPAILAIVKELEKAITSSGAGKDKLGFIQEVVTISKGVEPAPEVSEGVLSKIVSAAVTLFNKTGVFKTTPQPQK